MFIGIDPSINSTSITIQTDDYIKHYSFVYSLQKNVESFFDNKNSFLYHIKKDKEFEYNKNEIKKLENIIYNTELIIEIIDKYLIESSIISIEGYSYNSKFSYLPDLIPLSTLLRVEIIKRNLKINIIPPKSLKTYCASKCYEKDSKGVYRNDEGLAGGKFKKKEMMECFISYNNNSYLKEWVLEKDFLNKKTIPKPFDDIIDSFWLSEISKEINQS